MHPHAAVWPVPPDLRPRHADPAVVVHFRDVLGDGPRERLRPRLFAEGVGIPDTRPVLVAGLVVGDVHRPGGPVENRARGRRGDTQDGAVARRGLAGATGGPVAVGQGLVANVDVPAHVVGPGRVEIPAGVAHLEVG